MTDTNPARDQARLQMDSIAAMVAALNVDYDRLEELREFEARTDAEEAELTELEAAAGECKSEEDAIRQIDEDPLCVSVRSDWESPGPALEPAMFNILLCTGGPAVRIIGELDDNKEPCRAWIEYQDWGTPWSEYFGDNFDQEVVLTYCRQFYFGG